MPGRFPLFTDENIGGPLIAALRQAGWNVTRAVDVFGERTDDEALLEHTVEQGVTLVSTDSDLLEIAHRWLQEGRTFRLIWWKQRPNQKTRPGAFMPAFDALASGEEPFAFSIVYVKTKL